MDQDLLKRVWTSGDLAFSHGCGISPEDALNNEEISKQIRITATAIARHGDEFVAQYEFRDYPFFATQYHIEKTLFERNKTNRHLNRNPDLIQFAFDYMMTLVEPTRKYAKARADLDTRILGKLFEHKRPEKGMYSFFEQAYTFRRLNQDDYIKRTFRK